ncbi:MAG: chemotaxis response regulator protein-glutamate methylesterase [Clostridia bacterium]|nr:chemotaxis response regulator protein-glutamate methylesterase [Clostridia bacterium]
MLAKKIKVLVVDDSSLARKVITEGLSKSPDIEVVGTAVNVADARIKVNQLNPDVVTCDINMPGMAGIDSIEKLLPGHPVPVILVSALNVNVFEALRAGAVDFVPKPDGAGGVDDFLAYLTQKVIGAADAKVRVGNPLSDSQAPMPSLGDAAAGRYIIGLGASTGGTEATLEVMKRLPEDIPGMVIVQHMPNGFTKMYADRLNRMCQMEVREAKDGDEIKRGLALIAPGDFQCRVIRRPLGGYCVSVLPGEKVTGHRPSVDALFHSMAQNVRCKMVGIIMTGMGSDGAEGLLAMRHKGAFTIGQDKQSSVVYGMPGVAYNIGAVMKQAPCEKIAELLLTHLKTANV